MAQSSAPSPQASVHFKASRTLDSYNVPAQTWLESNGKTKEFNGLATACAVFHPTTATPHLLMLQRAARDSMPNKWELPGGAVDSTDPTVLHGAARELLEEAGLRARHFTHIITEGPSAAPGQVFPNSAQTKTWCRFTFGVEVEGDIGEVGFEVRLDPNEHQDFVWATEEEVIAEENAERSLPIAKDSIRAVMLEAFRLKKDREGESQLVKS